MDKKNADIVFKVFNDVFNLRKAQNYLSYEIIKKNREKRTVEVSTSLMHNPDGEPIGFYAVSRDVTDRKRMEEMMIQTEK
ncbi:MAG: PAS domain S-box protein [Deltaproteobacteria bacterium]|nr:PAS domain S-box protein [Deltaproteobacteria bacterium]MBT4088332.1 PAS domain S-box protein [Deltaproteobacteria bacterium]MBT4262874.1 PAS domain S-box protein [Deltaproteobacteria bacterium]MBT4642992.1 PAS domain S-box protein [Deltaproteobacteria bacterium]MBT6498591.1 PAS domain S-box protein [Deltaproteobacteria bacterium]